MQSEDKAYGQGKSIISAKLQGQQFIAVGNKLMYSHKWRTFPDFLFSYIKTALEADWWRDETLKPPELRHEILKWSAHVRRLQTLQVRGEDGLFAMVPDGTTRAYLLLANDLYSLRHNLQLQKSVTRRLKHPDQFQGALYELFVAAILVRAGFELEFENESDSSSNHPELIARHRSTGFRFAVEAKSRHRPGVLGFSRQQQAGTESKLGVHRLLNAAAAKNSAHPFVVFVELNLSPEVVQPGTEQWLIDLQQDIERFLTKFPEAQRVALLVATNSAHHYGSFAKAAPIPMTYLARFNDSIPSEIERELETALREYGSIPNSF